jgi:GNAT superfamily N-acetyltransferase
MKVRKAIKEDYKEIMRLYGDFIETDRFKKLGNDSFEKILDSPTNFIFVAEEGSRLAGLITASSRLVIRYPIPILQVDEFYVDPSYQRHGVGGKLMLEIENIARENGIERIYIESSYKHTLGHKFYEKHGYKNSGYYFLKTF